MFNKDVTHPKMRRRIERPRILLLDCNLEYKKGESQTNIEMMKEEDFTQVNTKFSKHISSHSELCLIILLVLASIFQ